MNLWLDDVRTPPEGWRWVKTVADAKLLIADGQIEQASLDHDLGACETCRKGRTDEQWFLDTGVMPHCTHVGTGYDLVLWMAEHDIWPQEKPVVHSMNPVGAARMRGAIERYYPAVADVDQARA